jgi:hypothetical protein
MFSSQRLADLPVEEQWEDAQDIQESNLLGKRFNTLDDAKVAAKVFILDRGESWGSVRDSDTSRMVLRCKRRDICNFFMSVGDIQGEWGIKKYRPHSCPSSTHYDFKTKNVAWYFEYKLQ